MKLLARSSSAYYYYYYYYYYTTIIIIYYYYNIFKCNVHPTIGMIRSHMWCLSAGVLHVVPWFRSHQGELSQCPAILTEISGLGRERPVSKKEHTEIYGYGSIPINSQLLGGWTSINPGYFDVNRRGTIGFDTLPYEVIEAHSISNAAPKLDGDNDKAAFPAGSWDSDRSVVDCAAREGLRVGCWEISALDQWNCNSRTTETLGVSYQII